MRTAVEASVIAQGSGITVPTAIEPLVIPKEIGVPSTIVSKLSGDGAIVIVSMPLGVEEAHRVGNVSEAEGIARVHYSETRSRELGSAPVNWVFGKVSVESGGPPGCVVPDDTKM